MCLCALTPINCHYADMEALGPGVLAFWRGPLDPNAQLVDWLSGRTQLGSGKLSAAMIGIAATALCLRWAAIWQCCSMKASGSVPGRDG